MIKIYCHRKKINLKRHIQKNVFKLAAARKIINLKKQNESKWFKFTTTPRKKISLKKQNKSDIYILGLVKFISLQFYPVKYIYFLAIQ